MTVRSDIFSYNKEIINLCSRNQPKLKQKKIMIRFVLFLTSLILSTIVSGQTSYQDDMKKGIELFEQGNFTESANVFEKIAENQTDNWLPNYYVALTNSLGSFEFSSDKEEMVKMLTKAQDFLDKEITKQPENVELMVVQTFIDTGWILYDPMKYGIRGMNKALQTFNKAAQIDPTNPRVAFSRVQFDMNSSRYMGGNPSDYCEDLKKAIELFATFKPETEFHPNWGLENAKKLSLECESKRN
jgi:tetratricopeptide (TPR) repeat protein